MTEANTIDPAGLPPAGFDRGACRADARRSEAAMPGIEPDIAARLRRRRGEAAGALSMPPGKDRTMDIECKDCECDLDYCCCHEACPVCGEAPTHGDGLAAFAAEFGFGPIVQAQ